MKKAVFVLGAVVLLSGCATWGKGGFTWAPYTTIVTNSPNELGGSFTDLSGRPDAGQKVQKQEYKKMGLINYSYILTPTPTMREKKWQEMIEEAKTLGADCVRQVRHASEDWEKELHMELLKYW